MDLSLRLARTGTCQSCLAWQTINHALRRLSSYHRLQLVYCLLSNHLADNFNLDIQCSVRISLVEGCDLNVVSMTYMTLLNCKKLLGPLFVDTGLFNIRRTGPPPSYRRKRTRTPSIDWREKVGSIHVQGYFSFFCILIWHR